MVPLRIFFFVLAAAAIVYLLFRLGVALRTYFRLRGQRLVTCPENKQTVTVALAAEKLALESIAGIPHLRLKDCTRWPEKQNCGQDCLSQVEADPARCLVWNIVDSWYQGKSCAFCGKPFGHLNWHDHKPAVVDACGNTVQWNQVPPEKLPEIFQTSKPVCWNCHIAESFRREHPELITDRLPH